MPEVLCHSTTVLHPPKCVRHSLVPYVKGLSEKIQRACKKGWCLGSVQINYHPCDSDSVYIGESGRALGKRVKEQKYSVKTGDRKMEWKYMHDWITEQEEKFCIV